MPESNKDSAFDSLEKMLLKVPPESWEVEICPICKNGQTCVDVMAHAKDWNKKGGN